MNSQKIRRICRGARGFATAVSLTGWCASLVGCAGSDPTSETETRRIATQRSSKLNSSPSTAGDHAEAVEAVFGSMEMAGPQASLHHEMVTAELLARPDALALLTDTYESAPKDVSGRPKRRMAVYLIAQLRTPEAVQMLEKVALSSDAVGAAGATVSRPTAAEPQGSNEEATRYTELPSRIRAAFGLVHSAADGVLGADASVMKVLASAEIGVAQMAAVELFAVGKLGDEHREVLSRRGISTKFRKYTAEEVDRSRRIQPGQRARRDGKPANMNNPPQYLDGSN